MIKLRRLTIIKMIKIIDLRSDTVTKPSLEMREAMKNAEVGDDFYREDPTVIELEQLAAKKLGKEQGLFVTSGTMGNLVSVLTHTQRGDSIIIEDKAHIFHNEAGNLAAIAGIIPIRLKGVKGVLNPNEVRNAIFSDEILHPQTSLLCIENPHNASGGTCMNPEQMKALKEVADEFNLKIHIDGARIFSAAIALNIDPKLLVKGADSITFCLSKNLACPFGSIIVGSKNFINKARKNRQMVGGGMRQAGIMAAAGIIALNNMVERLKQDHSNAKILAEGLIGEEFKIELETVQTNMVYFELPNEKINKSLFLNYLKQFGILLNPPFDSKFRAVTHYGINKEDIIFVLNVNKNFLKKNK